MLLHGRAITIPVEGELSLVGKLLEQLWWDPVGRIQIRSFVSANHHSLSGLHIVEDALNPSDTFADGSQKGFFFLPNFLLHAALRARKVRVGGLHLFDDRSNKLVEKGFGQAHLMTIENGSSQKSANHVALFLRSRLNIFMDRKGTSTDVIGNSSQPPPIITVRFVLATADLRRRLDNGLKNIDVKIGVDPLEDTGDAFQSHARIDILAWQRTQVVRGIPHAIELREDKIPYLDFTPFFIMVEDFTAWSTNPIGSLRRSARGPEVVVFPHTDDTFLW